MKAKAIVAITIALFLISILSEAIIVPIAPVKAGSSYLWDGTDWYGQDHNLYWYGPHQPGALLASYQSPPGGDLETLNLATDHPVSVYFGEAVDVLKERHMVQNMTYFDSNGVPGFQWDDRVIQYHITEYGIYCLTGHTSGTHYGNYTYDLEVYWDLWYSGEPDWNFLWATRVQRKIKNIPVGIVDMVQQYGDMESIATNTARDYWFIYQGDGAGNDPAGYGDTDPWYGFVIYWNDTSSIVEHRSWGDKASEYYPVASYEVWVDDDADASWYNTTHLPTIQEGIDVVGKGGTVHVYSGEYDGFEADVEGITVKAASTPLINGTGISVDGQVVGVLVSAHNVTIKGLTIHGLYSTGIYVYNSTTPPHGAQIKDNVVNMTGYDPGALATWDASAIMAKAGSGTPTVVSGNIIEYASVGDTEARSQNGINVFGDNDADYVISGNTITDRTPIENCLGDPPWKIRRYHQAINVRTGEGSATIEDNIITSDVGPMWKMFGIRLYGAGIDKAKNVVVENNTITKMAYAFWVSGPNTDNILAEYNDFSHNDFGVVVEWSAPGVKVNHNDIYGNTVGAYSDGAQVVDARFNWWGHASGPNQTATNPSGLGDKVTDNVTYSPWLGFVVGTTPMTYHVNPTGKIQDAIDDASPGDTIIVHAGTYDESLKINKSLNIIGSSTVVINGTRGSWDTDLKSHHPARAAGTHVYTAMDYVIGVYNGAIVNFINVVIDGENNLLQPTTYNYSAGVAFYNAGGSFSQCEIKRTKTSPEVCDAAGISIYVDTGSYTLEVDDCEFNTWGKRAIHAYGSGITLKVDDSTFTGNGGTGPAYGLQNGIVGCDGLDIEVTDSTFEEIRATGGSYESVGVMAGYGYRNYPQYHCPAHDLTVSNCTFYNTGDVYVRRSMGVWITTTGTAVVEDCTFTNTDGIVSEGTNNGTLYITSQDVTIRHCDFNGPSYPASVDYWTCGVIIQRGGKADIEYCSFNGFHDNDKSDGTGIAFYSWHDYSGSTGGSVKYCNFTDCVEGIYSGTTVTPLAINYNNFDGTNVYGIWNNDPGATIDGRFNWWGDASGPTHSSNPGGVGDAISDNVDYSPWLGFVVSTSPMTWHVNPTGAPGAIQEAVDEASSGDTILVHDGTYNEQVIVTKDNLAILAASSPILDGTGLGTSGFLIMADNVEISGFIIQNFTSTSAGIAGIELRGANYAWIHDNEIRTNNHGIMFGDSTMSTYPSNNHNVIEHNMIHDNNNPAAPWYLTGLGIYYWYGNSSYNTVYNNTIYNHDRNGILVGQHERWIPSYTVGFGGHTNWNITGNTVDNSGWYGIEITNGLNSQITLNNVTNTGYFGVLVQAWDFAAVSGITVTENIVHDSGYYGIYIVTQEDATTPISSTVNGLNITRNDVYLNGYHGIVTNSFSVPSGIINLTIEHNLVHNNTNDGMSLYDLADSRIYYNEVYDNVRNGIYLREGCSNNEIHNNNAIERNRAGIYLGSNVTLTSVKGNVIRDFVKAGIVNRGSTDFTIEENIISTTVHDEAPNGIDIGIYTGINGTVRENEISGCSWKDFTGDYDTSWSGSGILVMESGDSLEITRNIVYDCDVGMDIESDSMNITCNVVHSNIYGFVFWNANPVVHHNNIYNNTIYGVYRTPLGDLTGTLDAEYNWWGDSSGPYHNVTNTGGLGDRVSDGVDYDPWLDGPIPGDVAIISITPSRNMASEGQKLDIYVTVKNEGNLTITFNVTLYYDNVTIGTQTATNLAPGTNTTLTFRWDTTGVTPCINYTLSAEANALPCEIKTTNNILTDGKVKINIKGDINGDGVVDMLDISILIEKFLAHPGHSLWDPAADLNSDDSIDMLDISIALTNFLETHP